MDFGDFGIIVDLESSDWESDASETISLGGRDDDDGDILDPNPCQPLKKRHLRSRKIKK